MYIEEELCGNVSVAVVSGGRHEVKDPSAVLDLVISARAQTGSSLIAIEKAALPEDFFFLSTGFAGEALQKFINYHFKVAIYGDFSKYTSKPLHDFIYESNRGKDIFFVSARQEAVTRLAAAFTQSHGGVL